MIPPFETWTLPTFHIGKWVRVFDRLDSTNTFAATLEDISGLDGVVILAREQTAGRGQHGRTWQSPAGTSVLLSVILTPPANLCRPAILTAWAAVGVCDIIRELTGLDSRIKWPNDVLIADKKVCGILLEQRQAVIAGIGLNVNQTAAMFAEADLPLATSLALTSGTTYEADATAKALLMCLDRRYRSLVQGDIESVEEAWRGRMGLVGEAVLVECHDGVRRGRLREMSFAGLVLEETNGLRTLLPETVKHLVSV